MGHMPVVTCRLYDVSAFRLKELRAIKNKFSCMHNGVRHSIIMRSRLYVDLDNYAELGGPVVTSSH